MYFIENFDLIVNQPSADLDQPSAYSDVAWIFL